MKAQAAPWLPVAYTEAGVVPAPVGDCNPRIRAYHAGTNIAGYDDKVSWCSSFTNWCLGQVGLAGTGSALARSCGCRAGVLVGWQSVGDGLRKCIPTGIGAGVPLAR